MRGDILYELFFNRLCNTFLLSINLPNLIKNGQLKSFFERRKNDPYINDLNTRIIIIAKWRFQAYDFDI